MWIFHNNAEIIVCQISVKQWIVNSSERNKVNKKKMKASSGSYTPVILLCDEENSEKQWNLIEPS